MPEHDPHDPWADLAESLGASPSNEPSPPRPAPPPKAASTPRTEPKPKPAAPAANWDALASDLGIAGGASEPARPAPRPAEPPRYDREDRERPPRIERSREAAPAREERAGEPAPRSEDRERGEASGDEDRGERRGRRRRGRRGGRGRGRRDGDRLPGGERAEGSFDREPRDHDGSAREPAGGGDATRRSESEFGRRPEGRDEQDAFAADVFAPAAEAAGADAAESRGTAGREMDRDDEDRPRRRRRRGRRGGRSRSRGEARDSGGGAGERREPTAGRPGGEHDDEPLPAGYGVRPASRPADAESRGESTARGGEDEAGEGRGRRRRRRGRSGEGRSGAGRESSAAGGSGRGSQSRRGRRLEGESRSSSTLSRGRRADFAPVAGGYDEDDEGLEFLGVEEAGREAPRRESAVEDEILVESGLNTLRDVPSWVEAIGIVIAGNLDARSRSSRGEGGRR